MPTEAFGNTQVREVAFTQREIDQIILENLKARSTTPYDFDYDHPLIIHHATETIFRFVQLAVTQEVNPRAMQFKTLEEARKVKK